MGGRAFFFEMRFCRIAMVQMNPTVGDLDGNVRAMRGWVKEARRARADVVVFPEMAITGYPPLLPDNTARSSAAEAPIRFSTLTFDNQG